METPPVELDELDATATLAAVEGALLDRRRAEARDLALAAHWADLHASDPQVGPGGKRVWQGEDRLIEISGEGAPMVQELSIPELAIARRVHPLAARKLVADALDLRHRLPRCWKAVQDLTVETWVMRRIATMTRPLSEVAARLVDEALGEELAESTPGRLLEVAQARVIAADPERHAKALAEQRRKRYVTLSRADEFGLRHVIARVQAGDAAWVDSLLDRVADILASRYPLGTSRDELRSIAFGWLARPAELVELLVSASERSTSDEASPADAVRGVDPQRLRPQAVLYVHLHEESVRSRLGLVRVEEVGPLLAQQIPEWLGHANVTVKPVIDLADQVSYDAYEHAASLEERVHLRTPGDSFPHANQVSRRLDLDHVVPFVQGRRGQTGDHNTQPLGRTGHRAKTHLGYRVRQLRPGSYVWRTPHGLHRLVDHRGTHVLTEPVGSGLLSDDPVDNAVAQMALDLQATGLARVPGVLS